MAAIKRIQKESIEIGKESLVNITAGPVSEEDPYNWQATIIGPEDTPYAGGVFHLSIKFP